MKLEGKVAFVTGASRGIGRAIALALAASGADVVCGATTEGNAAPTAESVRALGRRGLPLGCRVEDGAAVTAAFRTAARRMGPVDILVNNAGFSRPAPILEMTEEDWDSHLDVNAKSVFLCSKAAAAQMLESERGGCIINVGSITGLNAFPNRLAYCTSKAAVHHMTRVMAIEWAERGIRVNCLAPGYTLTEMIEGLASKGAVDIARLEGRIPQRRLAAPEEIAEAAVFLASDSARYLTGSVLVVDGGWHAYGYV